MLYGTVFTYNFDAIYNALFLQTNTASYTNLTLHDLETFTTHFNMFTGVAVFAVRHD